MELFEIINKMSEGADDGWGKAYYHVLPRLIQEHKLKIGAEIGVAYGGHAEAMLAVMPNKLLYTIDPYQPDWEGTDGYSLPGGKNFGKEEYEELFLHALHRIRKAGCKFELLRKTSHEAFAIINEPLDFVFIDAKHTYENLYTDIFLWKHKVRKGGIIAGHDFDHPSYPGIRKAVTQHFKGWLVEDGYVWWTINE
jgi:predicted O-methyltransferase YrrM